QLERHHVAGFCEFNGLARERLRFAIEQHLGSDRRAIARALRPARGIAGLAGPERTATANDEQRPSRWPIPRLQVRRVTAGLPSVRCAETARSARSTHSPLQRPWEARHSSVLDTAPRSGP